MKKGDRVMVEGCPNIPEQGGVIFDKAIDPDTGEKGFAVMLDSGDLDLVSADMVKRINQEFGDVTYNPLMKNPEIPDFVKGKIEDGIVEFDGKETDEGEFLIETDRPTESEVLSYLSGQGVTRTQQGFFSGGQKMGGTFDRAYMQILREAPDRDFLSWMKGQVGEILAKDLSDRQLRRLTHELGYQSSAELKEDMERLKDHLEVKLNPRPGLPKNSRPGVARPNPPRMVQIVGVKPKPIEAVIETTTGEVLSSPGFPSYEGMIAGGGSELIPSVDDFRAEQARADFSGPGEAWSQFLSLNEQIAENLDKTTGGEGSFAARISERDPKGVAFEGIKNYYGKKTPITSLKQAVEYIVRKEKVKRWDDFPAWLLKEEPDFEFLQVPSPTIPIDAPSEADLEQAFDRYKDKFQNLWIARNLVEYYKKALSENDYEFLLSQWSGLLDAPQVDPYVLDDFKQQIFALLGVDPDVEEGDVPY